MVVAQLVRASVCGTEGRGFEPHLPPKKSRFQLKSGLFTFTTMQAPNPNILKELSTFKMPYGKYKGTAIIRIPVHYLEWMASQGFPKGRLGMLLSTAHVIKTNGLEYLVQRA